MQLEWCMNATSATDGKREVYRVSGFKFQYVTKAQWRKSHSPFSFFYLLTYSQAYGAITWNHLREINRQRNLSYVVEVRCVAADSISSSSRERNKTMLQASSGKSGVLNVLLESGVNFFRSIFEGDWQFTEGDQIMAGLRVVLKGPVAFRLYE